MPRRRMSNRLSTDVENLTEPILDGLCTLCGKIPFERVFQSTVSDYPFRYQLSSPDFHREHEANCRFCRFLTLIYDRILSPFLQDTGKVRSPQNLLYLISHNSEKPWFEIAGIEAPLCPRASIAWLQLEQDNGENADLSEPYVCISQLPDKHGGADEEKSKMQYALPRKRQPNEISCGRVNYGLIQEWLNICQSMHTERCQLNSVSFKRHFLDTNLIDVQNKRIVPDTKVDPYVALSYVWGADHPRNVETGKPSGRKRSRDSPGASTLYPQLPQHIPTTISDAMQFVEELGLKYLWVDWYCVDQEDNEAKQAQIENMHLVYECAFLTIIALDAQSMEEGLSGLSRPLKYTYQPEVQVPAGHYTATFVHSMWDNQGNSPWDLRAWTLQEALLSRRCLYFDRTHVYMTCAQELFHDIVEADEQEDRLPMVQSSSWYWQNGFEVILTDEDWHQTTYGAFVDCYTRRELTFQSDALNACRAALTQITLATGVGFLWGLPLKGLTRALLWQPDPNHCLQKRAGFPSWSWLGWVGRICYQYWLEEAEDYYSGEVETRISCREKNSCMQHDRPTAESLYWHDVRQNDVAAIHIKRTTETEETRVLTISSTVARFFLELVWQDEHGDTGRGSSGQAFTDSRKGDQWTLLDRRSRRLINEVGEEARFERKDYFFRLHPKASREIQKTTGTSHEFLFIEYWPAVRDHHESNNWLFDMVSALLIVKDKYGTYRREAAVMLKCSDWLAARPIPRVIKLH